ncbi:HD-GYP domain, c-di-GMP phosphodiesterase class II (or its inactivated variant) [Bacillus sp. cl95]|nr:HD-GYP domain, c-di-GMP phosphodiesterase class II (or its inactivated variant) [Bacillus sp. UNCCL13]SFQ89333.1 HD-GYP domain, c-di-GMP phosphodiesterase class II (or its inactivated variant) [Bacillus sp. cl95]
MRVKIGELQEGCILVEDVYSWTNRPIIAKKTVLNEELIEILNVFKIVDVNVEKTLITGMPFIPNEIIENHELLSLAEAKKVELGMTDLFLQAVNGYKKEFISWQSGLPIDINKVRNILMPLLEKMEKSPREILNLYHLSTREDYLYHHAVAVGMISGFIAIKLQYPKGDWVQIALAGCLADCGMAKINPSIFKKTSSLTLSEYEEVKNHPLHSYKLIQNIPVIRKEMKIAILQHHERLDGSGYPMGEREQKIHPIAKIIAVADTFHAMTSERTFRTKQSPYKAIELIMEDNFGKFDLHCLTALKSAIVNYTVGDKVKLSNGQIAEVLFIDEKAPTRPLLKLEDNGDVLPLDRNRQIFIEETLA